MQIVMAIFFFILVVYLFLQFARQEDVQEEYEEAVLDVEGRLEWAQTRRSHPFGMQAQLHVARELLHRAKGLCAVNRWQQAHRVALKSQEAMNRAQRIYISSIQADPGGERVILSGKTLSGSPGQRANIGQPP